mgnify:CR=1 FL=1
MQVEGKKGMARYNAMRTVEHDQLSGMKRTSDILKGQIDMLDTQISYSHFSPDPYYLEKLQSVEILPLNELNAARDQLQRKKDQIDRQWALGTSKRTLSETSAEARKQLEAYNAGILARPAASYKLQQMGYTEDQIKSLAEYQKFQSDYENYLIREKDMRRFAEEAPALATVASVTMAPFKALGLVESVRGVLPKGFGGYYNDGMPTNVYSDWFAASQNSDIIRSKVMEDMTPTEQFIYQTGTSILDGAVNL